MKAFFKDKNRMLIIGLVVAVAMCVVGYAMSVDNFTDYDPPNTLMINWHDYWSNSMQNSPSTNNKVTEWPRWSAQYPYRTILLGASKKSGTFQGYQSHFLVIYSKKPSTNNFTFEYIDFNRNTEDRSGYIRVKFPKDSYGHANSGEDLVVLYSVGGNLDEGTMDMYQPNNYPVYGYPYYIGDDVYFDFDFYYQCSDKHQQGAFNLNVSGLKNVTNVPYAYILTCENHSGGGGSESGSSGGGGSSGGSSGGGSSGGSPGGGWNSDGNDGRHGWGDGEYGGGVDRDSISSVGDGGGYSSRSDMELSVPYDWLEPWEDDYNSMPSEYKPDFPEYVPGEGDTGQTGEDWELPAFDFDNDGVSGKVSGFKEFEAGGEHGLIEFGPGIDDWGFIDFILDGQQGLVDFAEWGN